MSSEIHYDLQKLTELRKELHKNAELSNAEHTTASILKNFIKTFGPDRVFENIGGHGLIFEFKGTSKEALNIGFRADTDALPIDETIQLDHGSKTKGVAHKCGHDGHMTMVAGLASILAHHANRSHNYYLLFQPAEEIGEGAQNMVEFIQKEDSILLDHLFGLHNLPGFPLGEIVIKEGIFAPASTGIIIELFGKTSHAAEPENGISPATAMVNIISALQKLKEGLQLEGNALCTVIHAELGEIAFGTSPGYAAVRATLRAEYDQDLNQLISKVKNIAEETAQSEQLKCKVQLTDSFPSTVNDKSSIDFFKNCVQNTTLKAREIEKSFKWSEDFGHYRKIAQTLFFGLGAGEDHPKLHHETYDFPDDMIPFGVKMYNEIILNFEKHDGR